ncbi:hypothetical protein [Paenibacillus aceti]|nr:hypothetical protein [Paenibacillus aceti]
MKFTVIKNEDVDKYLDDRDRSELSRILWKIEQGRYEEGKDAANTYLVVNTDEPYAPEVIAIMKDHGHWGFSEDPNQVTAQIENDTLVLNDHEG